MEVFRFARLTQHFWFVKIVTECTGDEYLWLLLAETESRFARVHAVSVATTRTAWGEIFQRSEYRPLTSFERYQLQLLDETNRRLDWEMEEDLRHGEAMFWDLYQEYIYSP